MKKNFRFMMLGAVMLIVSFSMYWRGHGTPRSMPILTNHSKVTITTCNTQPPFSTKYAVKGRGGFTTADRTKPGLIFVDQLQAGVEDKHQEPTWKDFGRLGQLVYDEEGNMYTYSVTEVNVEGFSPERARTILKLDGKTGILAPFAEVPIDRDTFQQTFAQNPYGIVAITYDCAAKTLYVATIATSTQDAQRGKVYAVHKDSSVTELIRDRDVLSLAIVTDKESKYLFMGSSRESKIFAHKFAGDLLDPREYLVIDLSGNIRDQSLKVKRISSDSADVLSLTMFPFAYTLRTTALDLNVPVTLFLDDKGNWKISSH